MKAQPKRNEDNNCLNTNLQHLELTRCHCGKIECLKCGWHDV